MHIALIDDDKALTDMLSEYLQAEGYQVSAFYDGITALAAIENDAIFDAIVLDIMMPEVNGLDVLQQIRQYLQTPIIMVTGRGDDIDKILGLEMGADDYLSKPCNPRELLARLRAVCRRSVSDKPNNIHATQSAKVLSIAGITVDLSRRQVRVNNSDLVLTNAEFSTLLILMENAGEVVSKETLSLQVLHRELSAYDRSVDVHVSRLRKKLQLLLSEHKIAEPITGEQTNVIQTLRGQGYLLLNINADT